MNPADPLLARSMDLSDERRDFPQGHLDVVRFGGRRIGRFVLEPGWRWSESVAPLVGTPSCQAAHLGYVVSGRLRVQMDTGDQGEAGPGDAYWISPGHDAWVLGEEPAIILDVEGVAGYAAAV